LCFRFVVVVVHHTIK